MKLNNNKDTKAPMLYKSMDDAYEDFLSGKLTHEQYKWLKDMHEKKEKIRKRKSAIPTPFK
jgi:hypothetical protein